jgi:hypothetical protein
MRSFRPAVVVASVAVVYVYALGTAHAGCHKDTDCKGDRICDAGVCKEPPAEDVEPADASGPDDGDDGDDAADSTTDDEADATDDASYDATDDGADGDSSDSDVSDASDASDDDGSAEEPEVVVAAPLPTERTGPIVRALAGIGYSHLGLSFNGLKGTQAQTTDDLALEAGWQLGPSNLFVTGQAFLRRGNGGNNAGIGVNTLELGLGPGLEYWFMPHDVFVGGALAYFHQSYGSASGGLPSVSWNGVGVIGQAGKEWQVSPAVSLGIAVEVYGASMVMNPNGQPLGATEAGGLVAFSATYNRLP